MKFKICLLGCFFCPLLFFCACKPQPKASLTITPSELPSLSDAKAVESFTVKGMHCGQCELKIHDALAVLPGYVTEEIDIKTGAVRVGFRDKAPALPVIAAVIEHAGYQVEDPSAK